MELRVQEQCCTVEDFSHKSHPALRGRPSLLYPADDDDEAAHVEAGAVVDGAVLVEDRQRVGPRVPRRHPEHLPRQSRHPGPMPGPRAAVLTIRLACRRARVDLCRDVR